jgi:hypothetical protein
MNVGPGRVVDSGLNGFYISIVYDRFCFFS